MCAFERRCGPCRFIGPKFEALAKEFAHAGNFVKVDVDKNQEASAKCKVRCMPTFQLYKDGKKVGQMEGADEAALRKLIQKHAGPGVATGEAASTSPSTSDTEPVEKAAAAAGCCVIS